MLEPLNPISISASNIFYVITAFHGLLLAVFLWGKRHSTQSEKLANRLFSGLMLVLNGMLFEHAMDVGGYFFRYPWLIELSTALHFLIGPLLFGYISFQTSVNEERLKPAHFYHLILPLAQLLIVIPFVLNQNDLAKVLFYYEDLFPDLTDKGGDINAQCAQMFAPWNWGSCKITLIQALGHPEYDLVLFSPLALVWEGNLPIFALWLSLAGYIAASFYLLKRHAQNLHKLISNAERVSLSWIYTFVGLVAGAIFVYVVISYQGLFFEVPWLSLSVRNHIIYSLLGLSVVYVGHKALHQPAIFTADLAAIGKKLVDDDAQKYRNSAVTEQSARAIANQIIECLDVHEAFLDSQISLPKLSAMVGVNPHICSQVINESLQSNFFDLVNDSRLARVKQLLLDNKRITILEAAMAAGFNSKTNFYTFFKKREGKTPSAWRKEQLRMACDDILQAVEN